MRGVPSSPVLQAGTPLSFLTFTQIGSRLPSSSNSLPVALPGIALRSDQRSRRLTDKLQILPRNPWTCTRFGPELAGLAPQWAVACGQRTRGCRLRHRQFPGGELPRDQPARLRLFSATRILLRAITRARRSRSHARSGCSSWAIKGMVVTGMFPRGA